MDNPTNTYIKAYRFKIVLHKKTVIIPFKKTPYCDKMYVFGLRLKEFRVGEFTLYDILGDVVKKNFWPIYKTLCLQRLVSISVSCQIVSVVISRVVITYIPI